MEREIPVVAKTVPVSLLCGGRAVVKRLSRSERTDVASAAGLTADVASAMRFQDLGCRAAIVSVEGLTHCETGEPVAMKREHHPVIGRIASREVYDALTNEDVLAVLRAGGMPARPGEEEGLDEAQLGN